MSKLTAAAAAMVMVVSLAAASVRAETVNETEGVAIKGYDPVAYFTDNKPVKGLSAYTSAYDGVMYRFASDAHRKLFAANPAKYVPQFGGFCAYGTAVGHKADIDPAAFTIVDGKLYLNYSVKVRGLWQKDEPGYIHKAEEAWPTVSQQTEVAH